MMRVTEAIDAVFPKNMESYEGWLHEINEKHGTSLTPEMILEWASEFGTNMHAWCLEGRKPKNPTEIEQKCFDWWEKFKKERITKIIKVEQKILYKNLYHGTYDAIVEMDGLTVLLDLKFWQCWFWGLLPQEAPKELKENSAKLARANIQTYMYEKGCGVDVDARIVLSINPLGYVDKVMRKTPKKKFEQVIEFLKKQDEQINF